MNTLNNIHEKFLRLVTNDCDSNFNELPHELSIHKLYINYLKSKSIYMGYFLN